MKYLYATLVLLMISAPVQAACFADYKAKQDNPLRLHYGVVALRGPCNAGSARAEITARIAAGGWQLLNVVSVFDNGGLDQRRESAGRYFLRY